MVQRWDSMTQSLLSVFTRTMDSLNDDLARTLVGQKGSHQTFGSMVGKTLDGAAMGLAKSGLQKGEGAIMKALGFGGDKVSHVIVDNMPGGGVAGTGAANSGLHGIAGKAVGFLQGLFGGGAQKTLAGAQDTSGNLSMLQGVDTSSLPMLAGGGDVMAGHAAIIGEKGPELFVPHQSGTVMPNGGFGSTTNHYSIDASGSHDPAMTEAAVRRALHSTLKHAVSQSVTGVREGMRRQPKGASA
jgi:hypothetical protein